MRRPPADDEREGSRGLPQRSGRGKRCIRIRRRRMPKAHADGACRRSMPTEHADGACRRSMPTAHTEASAGSELSDLQPAEPVAERAVHGLLPSAVTPSEHADARTDSEHADGRRGPSDGAMPASQLELRRTFANEAGLGTVQRVRDEGVVPLEVVRAEAELRPKRVARGQGCDCTARLPPTEPHATLPARTCARARKRGSVRARSR